MFGRIINLSERVDRWNRMQPFIQKSQHDLKRFEAVKVKKESATVYLSPRARADFLKSTRYQHEAIFGVGAVGCALSHLGVWREFLQSRHEHAIILEDDVDPSFAADFDAKIAEMKDCDIFLLGWCGARPHTLSDGSVVPFPSSKGFVGAHAYVLNRRAAETLCTHAFPLEMQADFAIQAIADQFNLKIKCAKTPIKQKYSGSFGNPIGSNILTLCLFCEPTWVYSVFGILLSLLFVHYFKNLC